MRPRERARPAALALLLAAAVAMFGGVYLWAAAVLGAGAAVLCWRTGGSLAANGWMGLLDRALVAILAVVSLQLIPLPTALVAAVAPARVAYAKATSLAPELPAFLPLTIDPAATVHAWVATAAVVATFWSARAILARGGIRILITALAWTAAVLVLAVVAQEASGVRLVYGFWQPHDAGARPLGAFINRNHGGTWALLALGLCLGGLQWRSAALPPRPGWTWRARLAHALDGRSAVLALAVVLMVLLVALGASRSTMVALLIMTTGVACVAPRRSSQAQWRRVGALAVAGVLLAGAYADVDRLAARVDETRQMGLNQRAAIWRDGLRVARDLPLTGSGAGTFGASMRVYQTGDRLYAWNDGHNHYLQVLTEGGLLLTAPVAVGLVALGALGWRRLRCTDDPLWWIRLGAAAALTGAAVQSIWETGLTLPANGMLAAVAAAMLVHERTEGRQPTPRACTPPHDGRGRATA